jgi:hypothetical protein
MPWRVLVLILVKRRGVLIRRNEKELMEEAGL